jgi:anti-repressor protein
MTAIALPASTLVVVTLDGEARVSSAALAQRLGVQHASSLALVDSHLDDFEELGRVRFEIEPLVTRGGPQKSRVAYLTEDQSYLLLTHTRNTVEARACKLGLIQAFRIAREQGRAAPISALEIFELAAASERRRLELESNAAVTAPKVQAFDALMNAEGIFTVQVAAKLLGSGEMRLFRFLRDRAVLLSSQDCWNQPAQKFVQRGLFEIKVSKYTDPEGVQHARTKTFVTTKGLEHIRKLLEETRRK